MNDKITIKPMLYCHLSLLSAPLMLFYWVLHLLLCRFQEDNCEDLFAFMSDNSSAKVNTDNTIEKEIQDYLKSDCTETELVLQFPRIHQAFLRFNASLPSSAAVERLFSSAGQILVPRRCKLSDSMFEKLVFLRQAAKAKAG